MTAHWRKRETDDIISGYYFLIYGFEHANRLLYRSDVIKEVRFYDFLNRLNATGNLSLIAAFSFGLFAAILRTFQSPEYFSYWMDTLESDSVVNFPAF